MTQILNKTAAGIADITEKSWFTSYLHLQRIMFDCGTKFMAEFSRMCQNNYGLKRKLITTRNPQSNVIIKRTHKYIEDIIRTFDVSNIVNNDPWSGILAATIFAIRSNYHATIQACTTQLVFGQYDIFNNKHVTD